VTGGAIRLLTYWASMLGAFLIGSLPTAYLLVRALRHNDIRQMGSGNVGTMNVRGQLGTGPALLVLVLDGLKGALAVWLCSAAQSSPHLGLALAVAGHIYPPWLGFRGGKGLATALGGALILKEIGLILTFSASWLVVYLWLRKGEGDQANLAGALAAALYALIVGPRWALIMMLVLIADKHRRVLSLSSRS